MVQLGLALVLGFQKLAGRRLQHLDCQLGRFDGKGYCLLGYFLLQSLSLLSQKCGGTVKVAPSAAAGNRKGTAACAGCPRLNPHPQAGKVVGTDANQIPVVPVLNAGGLPPAAHHHVKGFPTVQAAVIVRQIKANVVTVAALVEDQCTLFHRAVLLSDFAGVHVMGHQRGIVTVDRAGRIEQHSQQVFLDVADFRSVLAQTVKDKLDVRAVQLHKLGFHQLCRVIVPGNADGLAGAAYSFHQQVHDLVQCFPVNALDVLAKVFVLDVVHDDLTINLYGAL